MSYRLEPIQHKVKPEQINIFRDFFHKFFPIKQLYIYTHNNRKICNNIGSVRITKLDLTENFFKFISLLIYAYTYNIWIIYKQTRTYRYMDRCAHYVYMIHIYIIYT